MFGFGGVLHPAPDPGWQNETRDGMGLRDYFAGQVLAGWAETHHAMAWSDGVPAVTARGIAEVAYQIADAMLVEREKPQG